MGLVLVVDGGRTSCRAAVFEHDVLVASATAPALPYRRAASLEPVLESVAKIVQLGAGNFGERVVFDAVVLGLASVDTPESFEVIGSRVRSLVRTTRMIVAVDVVLHYYGALGRSSGAVIAAGTGAIALARAGGGVLERSDGWGYILGDEGSGYWIGRRALACALRSFDGRESHTALAAAAERQFGPLGGLRDLVQGSEHPVGVVASFAPAVAQLARDGDGMSTEIWNQAGTKLAATLASVVERVFDREERVSASWAGGLFSAGEILIRPFRRHLEARAPAVDLTPPVGDALVGGSLLARDEAVPVAEGMVHEYRTTEPEGL